MRKIVVLVLLLLSQAGLAGAAAPHPRWPSLAEQLQRDRVKPGSALERLIRNNQDFQLLRPDEANDDRGIPPWLRVFWRKAHPELTYRAEDPSGGYPLVLKDIYTWMTYHQDLVPGQLQEEAVPEKALTVGANQRISGLQNSPRSESDIRINFWNANKVIAASNDIETSGMQAQFYSTDGGATWGQTSLPLITGDTFQGDPAVDWTSDGTAWATALGIVNLSNVTVKAYKSINGGATWAYDATVSGTQATPDKEMLWSDHSATSPFKDNLYVVWVYQSHTYLARRTGPAGAWGTPISVISPTFSAYAGADVKTNASGDVFVFWPGTDSGASSIPNRVFVQKSTDGGQSVQSAVTVGQTYGLYQYKIPAQFNRTVLIYVSGGAYKTASKNLVFASWNDLTGAAGCTSNANAPGQNTGSTCKSRIWFARSTDGGSTWSAPVMINNQPSLNDQFFPHLAVDETNGVVSLVYYDTVNDPGRLKTDVWYQSSYDDGVTWSAPSKVTTAQTDETVAGADQFNQYGDYIGMSAYSGLFLPSWTDRRNNAREEIWTAQVQDVPSPPPPPPVASFSFVCSFLTCSFDGTSSTGTGLSYAWSFGDSGTGTGSTTSHTYGASGEYTATLTVTDSLSRQSAKSKRVIVTSDPIAPAQNYFAVAPCRILDTRNTTILTNAQPRVVNIAGLCGIPSTAKAVSFNVTAVSPTGSGKIRLYPGDLTTLPPSTLTFAPATSPRANSAVIQLATNGTGTLGIYPEVSGSPGQVHLILDVQGYFSTDTSPAPGAIGPLGFQTLPVCRMAWPSSPLVAGTVSTFTAQGVCGMPVGAAVASLNIGVAHPAYSGYITLYPSNIATPAVSTLNFNSGISLLRNSARVNLSPTTPDIAAYFGSTSGATVYVHFDVNGYFKSDAPLKYHPITPCRSVNAETLVTGTVRTFQIQGNCGVPVGAKAALLRLLVAVPTSSGDLTVYPSNLPLSGVAVSTVKFDANEPGLSMGTIVPLSTLSDDLAASPGEMTAGGTVILSIDVFGYFQ